MLWLEVNFPAYLDQYCLIQTYWFIIFWYNKGSKEKLCTFSWLLSTVMMMVVMVMAWRPSAGGTGTSTPIAAVGWGGRSHDQVYHLLMNIW